MADINLTDALLGEDRQTIKDVMYSSINTRIANFSTLQSTDTAKITWVNLTELYTGVSDSGGAFYWSATTDKSTADGGLVLDPTVSINLQGSGVGLGCWVRANYDYINVKFFGAKGDGVTDDTTTIQRCISACYGKTVFFPKGTYCVSSTITINSQINIIGDGFLKDQYSFSGTTFVNAHNTVIKNIGTALTGGVVSVETNTTSTDKTSGVNMHSIAILAEEQADYALILKSVDRCIFEDMSLEDGTVSQLYLTTADPATVTMPNVSSRDTQQCLFRNIFAKSLVSTADGITLTSFDHVDGRNTSVNQFENCYVRHKNGTAYKLRSCDSNVFIHCRATRLLTDTGLAVELFGKEAGDVLNKYARTNIFYHFLSSQGGILSKAGDGTYPAVDNAFIGMNIDGNAVNITVTEEAGSRLSYVNQRHSSGLDMEQGVSFKAGDELYATRNSARAQIDTALTTAGFGAFAHMCTNGDGINLLALMNWSGPTIWNAQVENTSGDLTFTKAYGNVGRLYAPSFSSKRRVVGGSPTLDNDDAVMLVDASGASRVVTLPLMSAFNGRSPRMKIVRTDTNGANTVTIQIQGTDTLNGGTSETIAVGAGKDYVGDGATAWYSY